MPYYTLFYVTSKNYFELKGPNLIPYYTLFYVTSKNYFELKGPNLMPYYTIFYVTQAKNILNLKVPIKG
jgi:hypothetical protein